MNLNNNRDFWSILGISPTSNKRDIKKTYAKLLALYHPEEHPEKFEEINRAYNAALRHADSCSGAPADIATLEQRERYSQPVFEKIQEDKPDDLPFKRHERHSAPIFEEIQEDDDQLLERREPLGYYQPDIEETEEAELEELSFKKDKPYSQPSSNESVNESVFRKSTFWKDNEENLISEKLISETLDELRRLLDKRNKAHYMPTQENLDMFVFLSSERFERLKRNPAFIHGLMMLLHDYDIQNDHVDAIKKAFGIKNGQLPYAINDEEFNDNIYLLNAMLSSKKRYMKAAETSSRKYSMCTVLAIVLTIAFVAFEVLRERPAPRNRTPASTIRQTRPQPRHMPEQRQIVLPRPPQTR